MAAIFENFGLEIFRKDAEAIKNLLLTCAYEGRPVNGYGDARIVHRLMDSMDVYVPVVKRDKGMEVTGFNLHASNPIVMDFYATGMDLRVPHLEMYERVLMLKCKESGLFPVHIMFPNVLPSFLPDEHIRAQMCILPLSIEYFADEEICDLKLKEYWDV